MDRKAARLGATFALAMGALAMGAWPSTIAAAACPAPLPQGSDPVTLDPADFGGEIDNPYLPFEEGSLWIYQGEDSLNSVFVTDGEKEIIGPGSPNGQLRVASKP